jgi:hypothetical protein
MSETQAPKEVTPAAPPIDRAEAVHLLRSGNRQIWNSFREHNPNWVPDLSGERFDVCNLTFHNLKGSNLCGTDLSLCRMEDDRLGSATKLDGAIFDMHTKFPKGFNPTNNGAKYRSQAQIRVVDKSRVSVFISYAWVNEKLILAIDSWLRMKGLDTRLDKRDFFAGSRIRDEIMRVMSECEIILIFHSKDSADKPWPEFERVLASDLEMSAKQQGRKPPRIIYLVIDDSKLPSVSEENRIAIVAKGKRFELVCEELYHSILNLPRMANAVDMKEWSDYVFG